MSRTIKGSKGPGYDYWSRRNYKTCMSPQKRSRNRTVSDKVVTRRAERHVAKQSVGKGE